ncbi:MAG: hypothetical protein L0221_10265, partial [Chloroflexi bacterium]|nr:hypothetical protein [Chloroflexota bacterium]
YAFITSRGLTLFEPGLSALEATLGGRLFMYQNVYFHRTVRAFDLDLAEAFGPSIRAIYGAGSPAADVASLSAYADLDEYALLHQAGLWVRGESVAGAGEAAPAPGSGRVTPAVAEAWRAVLLRRPRWRLEQELRASYEAEQPQALIDSLGAAEPGRVAIDLATVDARPGSNGSAPPLWIEPRDGVTEIRLSDALSRLPAYALIARRYRRSA